MKQNIRPNSLLMLGSLIASLWASAVVAAPPVYKPLAYLDGDTKLEAQVVQDPALQGKRPVLILAHEQGPASPLAKLAASKFAALGAGWFSWEPGAVPGVGRLIWPGRSATPPRPDRSPMRPGAPE